MSDVLPVPRMKTLSHLQPRHMIVYEVGRVHVVMSVNDSRAVIKAVERKVIAATDDAPARTASEGVIGISPNSEVAIVGWADDELWARLGGKS